MAAGDTMVGKRLPLTDDGKVTTPRNPGEYCGPIMGYTGDKPMVSFLKPNARDADAPASARSIQHVVSPPHVFTEEPDGTLTISASIGDLHTTGKDAAGNDVRESDGWHGYLERGVWREV